MSMLRTRAIAATVAVLLSGQATLAACSDDGGDGAETSSRECQTSDIEMSGGSPAGSPREAVQALFMPLPGQAPGASPLRITDVVELADDRARVDVTLGNWEGGYEVEREGEGWVLVAGISCGEPLTCSDLKIPDTDDAYGAVLCAEPSE